MFLSRHIIYITDEYEWQEEMILDKPLYLYRVIDERAYLIFNFTRLECTQ